MLTHKHHHHHSPSHMGPPPSTPSFFTLTFSLLFITLTLFRPCILAAAYAESNDSRATPLPSPNLDDVTGGIAQSPPLALYNTQKPSSSSFKPGVFIVVGVLTLMFSLTFLLLLYIKHCNGGNIHTGVNITSGISASRAIPPLSGRKNSGIDRSIVESLPIFRFGSLRGQKDGLDCAVCLNKFEAAEVLRLLPKCKHAFHVECVDTWLDAHSTCPLCRYRVDPEDILLVDDAKVSRQNKEEECLDIERGRRSEIVESRRRHSSVEERESERERERRKTASFRRSLDSATSRKKNESVSVGIDIGCFVRPRKDGMLLTQDTENRDRERERDRTSVERRLEHRIIVSPSPHTHNGLHLHHQRWSDVQPSDLLYLTSEMIISESRRVNNHRSTNDNDVVQDSWNGRGIINSRSVSEITGLSRFSSNNNNNNGTVTEREEGLVSRWLAWISQSHSQPAVR